jgi:hypothetical protein
MDIELSLFWWLEEPGWIKSKVERRAREKRKKKTIAVIKLFDLTQQDERDRKTWLDRVSRLSSRQVLKLLKQEEPNKIKMKRGGKKDPEELIAEKKGTQGKVQ